MFVAGCYMVSLLGGVYCGCRTYFGCTGYYPGKSQSWIGCIRLRSIQRIRRHWYVENTRTHRCIFLNTSDRSTHWSYKQVKQRLLLPKRCNTNRNNMYPSLHLSRALEPMRVRNNVYGWHPSASLQVSPHCCQGLVGGRPASLVAAMMRESNVRMRGVASLRWARRRFDSCEGASDTHLHQQPKLRRDARRA